MEGGALGSAGELVAAVVAVVALVSQHFAFKGRLVSIDQNIKAYREKTDERYENIVSDLIAVNKRVDHSHDRIQSVQREFYSKMDKISSDLSDMKSDIKLLLNRLKEQ